MSNALVFAIALGGLVSFFEMSWQSVAALTLGLFALFVWTLYKNQGALLYQRAIYPQYIRPDLVRAASRPSRPPPRVLCRFGNVSVLFSFSPRDLFFWRANFGAQSYEFRVLCCAL